MSDVAKKSRDFLHGKAIHEQWQTDYLNPSMDRFYDLAFTDILKRINASPTSHILDAGCGYCYHTKRLARSGAKITAVDFSEAALSSARDNLGQSEQAQIALQQADLTDLPFADSSFDSVVCWGVLMHIPEMEKALAHLTRVLKKGGILALNENNVGSLDVQLRERTIDGLKGVLGRKLPRKEFTARGTESWHDGGLLVRKTDVTFLTTHMRSLGAPLIARTPSQFTEAYTTVPGKQLKEIIYRFNEFYFRNKMSAKLAMGNILYFKKS
jgi:2-polyprenyl-3-methyl-5-hydroxy-6-metoxy-1,4-benzoquinol methylase